MNFASENPWPFLPEHDTQHHKAYLWPAVQRIAVNALGKWKTVLQMVGVCSMYVWRDQAHLFGPEMGGESLD